MRMGSEYSSTIRVLPRAPMTRRLRIVNQPVHRGREREDIARRHHEAGVGQHELGAASSRGETTGTAIDRASMIDRGSPSRLLASTRPVAPAR